MSEQNNILRKIEPADEKQWQTMWKAYQEFYQVDLSDTAQDTWQRLLGDDSNDPNCIVLIADGDTVGFVTWVFHKHTWGPQQRCYLIDLYVDPNQRGKSLGRALIEAVYNVADEAQCSQVYWLTQDHNEAGRRLYDRVATLTPFIKYQR